MKVHSEILVIEGHPNIEQIVDVFEAKLGVKLMARLPNDVVHGYINCRKFYEDELPKTEVEVCLYEENELPTDQNDTSIAKALEIATAGKSKKEKADIRAQLIPVLGGHTTSLKKAGYLDRKKRDLKNQIGEINDKKLSIEKIHSMLKQVGGK